MNFSMVSLFSLWIFVIAFALASEQHNVEGTKQSTVIRQKKRIVAYKKPFRYNERMRGRQANYHRGGGTVSSMDEFATASVGTSENPNGNWKPIPYARYAEEAVPVMKSKPQLLMSGESSGKPAAVNTVADGESGLIERVNKKNVEPEAPATAPQHEHTSGEQFEDYALLHYYIPFDQLISQTSKPIMETFQDIPPKQVSIEQLMKAAVEPIPVFRVETTPSTTSTTTTPTPITAAPTTTAKAEPSTTAAVAVFSAESKTQEKEEEMTGKYEYEYFVQDNHWGTNFGHKEFRDGKQTKGDYEVVLPDGRVQHVQYWSDATGYHASVTYHPLYKTFKQYKLQS